MTIPGIYIDFSIWDVMRWTEVDSDIEYSVQYLPDVKFKPGERMINSIAARRKTILSCHGAATAMV